MQLKVIFYLFIGIVFLGSCNDNTDKSPTPKEEAQKDSIQLKEDAVTYSAGNTVMNGLVVYNENSSSPRPGILVVHEWWGLNDYTKNRARQLARMGYVAMAVDMFGNGQTAANPDEAMKLAGAFYQDPSLTKTRLDAALAKLKSYSQTDTSKIAAIGYCYGGFVVLNAAKLGVDLDGVVSFHGGLAGVPARKDLLKAKILVCHGEKDNFVPAAEVQAFKKSMDSISADYTFKTYPGATHAFTNPDATENGKKFNMPIEYNAAADSTSWNDMKDFFGKIFK
ncbi:MAG TPA: dienelactone hydrolase family protein [Flavitalea sp.]|nr:dienelactone hydrolase family protein [Flavitalea sp.]